MKKTIWKYRLDVTDMATLVVPLDSDLLDIQANPATGLTFDLWALVDSEETYTTRWDFRIYGTGHPVEANHGRYFKTVRSGSLVWHIFID